MKISHKWLNSYLHTQLSPNKISEILTDIGLEVESTEPIETVKGGLKGVVVGHVLTCEKHPDADKLSITTVNVGEENPLQIVCGAPNVAVGQNVPVATIGTVLYDGDDSFQIKKSKIRGVVSEGMICAEDELGLGVSHDGIMVLNQNAVVGTSAKDYFGIEDDVVYEIGLTPNRSDATSHYGVARDLAAALNCRDIEAVKANLPSVDSFIASSNKQTITLQIENSDACPRYSGLHIKNISVSDSPKWLQNRLLAIGIRPINNIVDITNFVLFEIGQPLHAFDASKIEGNKIIVRKALPNSKFTTLDGVERLLNGSELMICNSVREMCIAGVYGGLDSGVSENTTEIFLESAYFNPVSIRKTSKLHNLKTDSSFRFERGCDPNITIYALKRAALLIAEIAGGTVASEIVDAYPTEIPHYKMDVKYDQINSLIGTDIPKDTTIKIIEMLGIVIEEENIDGLTIQVPLFKVDVTRPVDVIEEVLRIYGYNAIENPNLIKYAYSHQPKQPILDLKERISDYFADNGMLEAMNNSLTRVDYFEKLSFLSQTEMVKLLNPLSRDLGVMRQSLLPGLLENVMLNINHKNSDIKLFEFGNTYRLNDAAGSDVVDKYPEELMLDVVISGNKEPENWDQPMKSVDFYEIKKIALNLLKKAGINSTEIVFKTINDDKIDGLEMIYKNQTIGLFGEIVPSVLKVFSIKQPVFHLSIYWLRFVNTSQITKLQFKEINNFPAVRRDLALLVDHSVPFEQIKEIAFKVERKLLKSVGLFDVYIGDKVDASKKSYAVSFALQHSEKTLSDFDINNVMNRLIKAFEEQLGATLR
ncbi:MAG: phenylalanine--tRNA ligase subunit beta [Bacteroidota bacterium]